MISTDAITRRTRGMRPHLPQPAARPSPPSHRLPSSRLLRRPPAARCYPPPFIFPPPPFAMLPLMAMSRYARHAPGARRPTAPLYNDESPRFRAMIPPASAANDSPMPLA